jgi:histone arginine demethylase JMJD6
VLTESSTFAASSERITSEALIGIARVRAESAAALMPLHVPVIFTDASDAWPIRSCATPEYFRHVHGSHPVRVLGTYCTLAQLIARLERATPDDPGPYPCKFEIAKDFRELLDDVTPRPPCSLPDRQANPLIPQRLFAGVNNLEIFFGGAGGKFPYLHYDVMHLHAWIAQLYGDKEFLLYAPDQEPFLYARPDLPWQSGVRNPFDPDFTRYPLLRKARAQRVVLHAGETLFLPAGWWHSARNLTMTISVAFDQLAADNWNAFVDDVVAQRRREGKSSRALLLGVYLHLLAPLLMLYELLGGNRKRRWGQR